MRRCAAAALLVLALPACGDAAQPVRLPELEAEVQAATRALVEAPGFTGLAVRAGLAGTVVRVDWVDWRGGDYRYLAIGQPEPEAPPAVFGLVQVGGELYSAQLGPDGDRPWARLDEQPTQRIPLSLQLAEIAAGNVSPVAEAQRGAELTREVGPGGEVSWTMVGPHRGDRLAQAWVIDGDGVLRAFTVATASRTEIQDGTTSIEYGFTPLPELAPVTPPELGTALEPSALGAPADLPLLPP